MKQEIGNGQAYICRYTFYVKPTGEVVFSSINDELESVETKLIGNDLNNQEDLDV